MKAKLLFIIGSLGVGGKERQMLEIINNLDQNMYIQKLIIKEKNGYYYDLINKEKCDVINVDWKGYNFTSYKRALNYSKELIKIVNNFKPDFVISFSKEFSYLYSLSSILYRYKPVFINLSIRDAPNIQNYKIKLDSLLYDFYKVVVANSEAGLKAYNQLGKQNRYVLYNGLNENRISKIHKNKAKMLLNIPKERFIITSIANFSNRKDHLTLIHTIKELNNYKSKNILFLFVGEGKKRKIIECEIEKNNLGKNIKLLGSRNDVEIIIRASDIVVLSSYTEGISNSVIESMYSGVPVLATGEGGLKETIIDDYNGFRFDIGDYLSLSQKIIDLFDNPKELNRLGLNAYKYAKNNFTVKKMINSFEKLLKKHSYEKHFK